MEINHNKLKKMIGIRTAWSRGRAGTGRTACDSVLQNYFDHIWMISLYLCWKSAVRVCRFV